MANWKLKELRDERRRTFLKMCTVASAAVGIERSRLLNFLADEGGSGLAEAAGATYGRSLIVPCPNGAYAWFNELWPPADVGLKACGNVNVAGLGELGSRSAYLYTTQLSVAGDRGFQMPGTYRGTYAPGKGVAMPTLPPGVKGWAGGDRPFFYGPDAPCFDHANGIPKYPVTALMSGKDETHTAYPTSAAALSGSSTLQAALASLGTSGSSAIVPVLGIDPIKYGRAPGAPDVATVPTSAGMVDLFNSAASQFTLAGKFEQEMFETYFKAIIGLRKSSPRSAWAPQIAVTKNAARIIGLNFASQLTPTIDDLSTFGIQEMLDNVAGNANYLASVQRVHLEEFGRVLVVVAKAFALGLSKTAIVPLPPGGASDSTFTDPHDTFSGMGQMMRGRNTTKHLGRAIDGFYKYLSQQVDPESPTEMLDKNTVFVAYGDTPHDPLNGAVNSWADAMPDACNWSYVMDPRGNLKNGWFGQCSPVKFGGKNGFGYDPITGLDNPSKTSDQMSSFSSTAAVFAVARGDKNKVAEYGTSANSIPGLINSK